jgi:hypothetical protein
MVGRTPPGLARGSPGVLHPTPRPPAFRVEGLGFGVWGFKIANSILIAVLHSTARPPAVEGVGLRLQGHAGAYVSLSHTPVPALLPPACTGVPRS